MAGNDILSQDEIDALLSGVETGSVKTENEFLSHDGVVRTLDLTTQDRIIRGRMPTLEMVNQRFARLFRISLFNMLRRSPEIAVSEVQMFKFSDYVHSLFVPASLNLVRIKPLRGTGLLVFDPKLVFAIVNHFFGGDSRFQAKIEGREFTATEQRIIQRVLTQVFRDLKEAWTPVMPLEFEFLQHEVNPQFANIVSPTEVVVVCSFRVDMEGVGGDFHVTLPYSMVEPIRDLLDAGLKTDRDEVDDRWSMALREEMKEAMVSVSTTLTETELSLRDILSLVPGDVIPVDIPDHVVLRAEGVPVFRGRYGVSRGSCAVKLTGPVSHLTGK